MLHIIATGSFKPARQINFDPSLYGHLQAVRDAMRWLEDTMLPIALNHDLTAKASGESPKEGWGREFLDILEELENQNS